MLRRVNVAKPGNGRSCTPAAPAYYRGKPAPALQMRRFELCLVEEARLAGLRGLAGVRREVLAEQQMQRCTCSLFKEYLNMVRKG